MTTNDITRLESRILELEEQQDVLRKKLAQAEIDRWEGRIEDLQVQLHLGRRELTDRLAPLVDTLRDRWLDAKDQIGLNTSTAGDVVDTLRSGLEQAMDDIRSAALDAKKIATG